MKPVIAYTLVRMKDDTRYMNYMLHGKMEAHLAIAACFRELKDKGVELVNPDVHSVLYLSKTGREVDRMQWNWKANA